MKIRVYLVRHGIRLDHENREAWNTQNSKDPPLAESGFLQAIEVGKYLQDAKIKYIYSSPYLRTVQTASTLAKHLHPSSLNIRLENGLREAFGVIFEGWNYEFFTIQEAAQQYENIDREFQSYFPRDIITENEQEVNLRAKLLLQYFANQLQQDTDPEEDFGVILVTHAAPAISILRAILQDDTADVQLATAR
jgi:broad specificity phosphatase PhoE